ncbi:MAG: hypothetical protein K9M17_05445 [Mariprofundaceae bacterium]|nr:hypothetical protein [Mariprofundaceae bacterium]
MGVADGITNLSVAQKRLSEFMAAHSASINECAKIMGVGNPKVLRQLLKQKKGNNLYQENVISAFGVTGVDRSLAVLEKLRGGNREGADMGKVSTDQQGRKRFNHGRHNTQVTQEQHDTIVQRLKAYRERNALQWKEVAERLNSTGADYKFAASRISVVLSPSSKPLSQKFFEFYEQSLSRLELRENHEHTEELDALPDQCPDMQDVDDHAKGATAADKIMDDTAHDGLDCMDAGWMQDGCRTQLPRMQKTTHRQKATTAQVFPTRRRR